MTEMRSAREVCRCAASLRPRRLHRARSSPASPGAADDHDRPGQGTARTSSRVTSDDAAGPVNEAPTK